MSTVDLIHDHWRRALGEGRLELTGCLDCDRIVGYPRSRCPYCMTDQVQWRRLSGRGRIHSYTVNRRGTGRYLDADPFVIAYVELDEGPRMLAHIRIDPEQTEIGSRVEVVAVGPDQPLTFTPVPS